MAKRGKKYLEVAQKVDNDRLYSPEEATKLVKEVSYSSFDGTVEVHLRMGFGSPALGAADSRCRAAAVWAGEVCAGVGFRRRRGCANRP